MLFMGALRLKGAQSLESLRREEIMFISNRKENIPEWYWKNGLHDAKILSVSEIILLPDWKTVFSEKKYLEIRLDGRKTLYERNITEIALYDYSIRTKDLDLNTLKNAWWLNDTVESQGNGFYRLTVEYLPPEAEYSERFIVEFSGVKINRD